MQPKTYESSVIFPFLVHVNISFKKKNGSVGDILSISNILFISGLIESIVILLSVKILHTLAKSFFRVSDIGPILLKFYQGIFIYQS